MNFYVNLKFIYPSEDKNLLASNSLRSILVSENLFAKKIITVKNRFLGIWLSCRKIGGQERMPRRSCQVHFEVHDDTWRRRLVPRHKNAARIAVTQTSAKRDERARRRQQNATLPTPASWAEAPFKQQQRIGNSSSNPQRWSKEGLWRLLWTENSLAAARSAWPAADVPRKGFGWSRGVGGGSRQACSHLDYGLLTLN